MRNSGRRAKSAAVLCSGLFSLWATAAGAQSVAPSQVTPSSLRPAASGGAGVILPNSPSLEPPPNAASLALVIGGVTVQGGFDDLAEETRAITSGLAGRRVSVAEIYTAASALEGAYAHAGYALVRVTVPPQKLDPHGSVRFVVVDGYIEDVDVKALPERDRKVVAARLAPLIGKRHIKIAEIERRVLLAGAVPGLSLKSTLAAGAGSGAGKLVLQGAEKLISGDSGVDNNLPRSLKNWEFTRNLQINNPFGYGEQFYFSATTGYEVGKLFNGSIPIQIFGGGFVAPLGIDGLTINPEYTNAVTRPAVPGGAPKATGYFQRADLRASYPLVRTRKLSLNLTSVLEWDQEHMRLDGFGDQYRDNYLVWRGKAESQMTLSGGATLSASGGLSQGLGGRTGSAAPALSHLGATPHFTKFDADARYVLPLPESFSVVLLASAQTSFGQPLMVSEQFALDGPGAVSGFPTGTFVVDEGGYGRAELGRTFTIPLASTQVPVEPYLFGAAGFGRIVLPQTPQQGSLTIGSFGLGARASINTTGFISGADFAVEAARFVSDVPNAREGWRGNLTFSIRF